MKRAEERLWRTRDGQGLVRDGDPDAAILAYAAGDEISAADEVLVAAEEPEDAHGGEAAEEPEGKQEDKPADKARRPAANKSRGSARRGT